MRGGVCIGALTLRGKSLRLKDANGAFPPSNSPYDIGGIWEVRGESKPEEPPHVEDFWVIAAEHQGLERNVRRFILDHVQPWRGGLDATFEGLLQFTSNGSGYIAQRTGVPGNSTGFWVPDRILEKDEAGNKVYFRYAGQRMAYVGFEAAPPRIAAGTLVRLSLARWWTNDPGFEERCYLQLSGWF